MGKRTQLKTWSVGCFLLNINVNHAIFIYLLLSASILLERYQRMPGYHSHPLGTRASGRMKSQTGYGSIRVSQVTKAKSKIC